MAGTVGNTKCRAPGTVMVWAPGNSLCGSVIFWAPGTLSAYNVHDNVHHRCLPMMYMYVTLFLK